MKIVVLILAVMLSGCSAVKIKESYRNNDYNQKLDTISVKWTPLANYVLNIHSKGYSAQPDEASVVTRQQLNDLETRTPKILKTELLKYDVDVVPYNQSKNILIFAPEDDIKVNCRPGLCRSNVTILVTLKERLSDTLIWSGSIRVASTAVSNTKVDANGKEEIIVRDTTRQFAETIVGQLNSNDLLPALLATPRVSATPDITPSTEKRADLLDKADVSYEKLIIWAKENNKWGASSGFVKGFQKELDSAIGKKSAVWEIGAGLTKSEKAFRIEWLKDSLNITELSPEEAAAKGIEKMKEKFTTRDAGSAK